MQVNREPKDWVSLRARQPSERLLAVALAAALNADVCEIYSDVDGVYTADPKTDPNAEKLETVTFRDALKRGLKVVDSTAFSLCMDNKMPIIVFDFFKPHNLRRVVMGEKVGTVVNG